MQFKALFAAVLSAQSVFAMSSTQQGQIKQNDKSIQMEQIHQLEDLAQTIQAQRQQMAGILTPGAPLINASTIATELGGLATVLSTAAAAVSNITAATLVQQFPLVLTTISGLANTTVVNAGNIITTPVIGIYNVSDQAAIFDAFTLCVDANTALINTFVGPNGIVTNSILRGVVGTNLNLLERTIVDLAGAVIARIPAFAQQAQSLVSQLHASLGLTINF
ncbi:hypothetical protein ACQKWADRAFT_312386 [Trichoderma austrokoningii]